MLRGAAAIHYTTERERVDSETMLGLSNGVVIPLGVDLATSSSQAIEQSSNRDIASTVLFLSRLHPKKNVELLIDAFDAIAAEPRFREWHLVIAGDGNAEYVASLRKRATAKASAERIRFCGWLDGEGKSLAFTAAGLFVLPSVQENFGLAALEAMAHGVPVAVSADVDLSDEVAASGAGWVFPRTAGDLSRTLADAMADPREAKKRGEKGRKAVERRFRWTGIAGELESLYRRVDEDGRLKVRRRATEVPLRRSV
jgi:glycosyltransferase involved in cell wall biosynthesis